jgi:UDP-N-acetylmuramate dehydrogenase
MYQLKHNFSLKSNNTFGISSIAKHYLTVGSGQDLVLFFKENNSEKYEKRLFLGGGSNLLFLNNYDGLVIHPQIDGIHIISEDKQFATVEAGAGVVWDHFVEWCVQKDFAGVENLSLIPGSVGAVPVQNIGAYGIEAESVITKVNGIDLKTFEYKSFNHDQCKFGYRTSIFKVQLKEQFMVTSVVFQLPKKSEFHLEYGSLETQVSKLGEKNLRNIRSAVIAMRESKLPDPTKIGNAGSFFKNPIVSQANGIALKNSYPDLPVYPFSPGFVKLAAGWLIEKAGWKGRCVGKSAVHNKQALVIINLGDATGKEIFELSQMVVSDVLQKFNIELEREVQIIEN